MAHSCQDHQENVPDSALDCASISTYNYNPFKLNFNCKSNIFSM